MATDVERVVQLELREAIERVERGAASRREQLLVARAARAALTEAAAVNRVAVLLANCPRTPLN